MTPIAIVKESKKEEKAKLRIEISSLKNSISEFKDERKSEWKIFKNQFKSDLSKVEKSIKDLKIHHKK